MINLKSKEKAPASPQNNVVTEAFIFGTSWEPLDFDEFQDITLGDIWNGVKRVILMVEVRGEKIIVVTTPGDEAVARRKYPGCPVINAIKMVGFFKGAMSGELKDLQPEVLLAMTVFEGAKVDRQISLLDSKQ